MMIACPQCLIAYCVPPADFGLQLRVVQCSACGWRWTQAPEPPFTGRNEAEALIDTVPDKVADQEKIKDDIYESNLDCGSTQTDVVAIDEALQLPEAIPGRSTPIFSELVPKELMSVASNLNVDKLPKVAVPPKRREPFRLAMPINIALAATFSAVAMATCLFSILILLHGPIIAFSPSAVNLYRLLGLATVSLGAGLEIRNIESARDSKKSNEIVITGEVANVIDIPVLLPSISVSMYDADHNELRSVTLSNSRTTLSAGGTLSINARLPTVHGQGKYLRVGFVD